jgi:hypothetical protein
MIDVQLGQFTPIDNADGILMLRDLTRMRDSPINHQTGELEP